MTTLTVSAQKHWCSFCEAAKAFFKKSLNNYRFARQMEANRRVAADMIHLGFHNQKEYNQILMKLNDRAIEEYNRNK